MKKRNDKFVEKCFWASIIILVIIFIIIFSMIASSERNRLQEKYNLGVEYYNNGEYIKAMDVFSSFETNWGRGETTTDEYYEMAKNAALNDVQYEVLEVIRYATEEEQIKYQETQIKMLAKVVWGEARGCSKTEQAAVVWCILNRVDHFDFSNEITEVITQENQFDGYAESNPINYEIVDLCKDVINRWVFEKTAVGSVGRVLPKEYVYFYGDGVRNYFRDQEGNVWDWTLKSPYEEIK